MQIGEKESLLIAAFALVIVLVMLLWGIWYLLGLASGSLQQRFPWLRAVTFSLAVIAVLVWFVVTYRDALIQLLNLIIRG